jgi:hypothetical protein
MRQHGPDAPSNGPEETMQARLQEIYRTLGQWSSLIDTLYRRVWNGKVLLAGLAEGLGGLGLGLLGYQALKRRAQALGVALLVPFQSS